MSEQTLHLSVSQKSLQKETLRISISGRRKEIKLRSRLFRYRDKDTRQMVVYIPALEITGYGSNEKKAMEMLNFSVKEYFAFLSSLAPKKIETELLKLGWKHTPYRNKEYSKTFVDVAGNLQNFNAVANQVEQLTVEA